MPWKKRTKGRSAKFLGKTFVRLSGLNGRICYNRKGHVLDSPNKLWKLLWPRASPGNETTVAVGMYVL